jgi:predicted DCC family thiol-disulfide oxidoreductase YuxK
LQAVNISAPEFDPQPYSIPLGDFMYELHVMDQKGQVYRGVDAFWAIWQAFPASPLYGVMGTIINLPVVHPVARLVYQGFARIRPYLPNRKNCHGGTCSIGRH